MMMYIGRYLISMLIRSNATIDTYDDVHRGRYLISMLIRSNATIDTYDDVHRQILNIHVDKE